MLIANADEMAMIARAMLQFTMFWLRVFTCFPMNPSSLSMRMRKTRHAGNRVMATIWTYIVIVTRGAQGSVIYADGREIEIPTAKPAAVTDPTGCGDAYRAGLIFGLMNRMDWETTGRIASLMGALKIAHAGTQNHRYSMDEFRGAYRAAFGRDL